MKFEPYSSKYLNQVVELLAPLWGHLSMSLRKKYFTWKYLLNPSVKNSSCFVAIDETSGKVIAFRGFLVMQYRFNDKKIFIVSYSDAVVNPEFSGKGIFKSLTIFGMKEMETMYKGLLYSTISNDSWRTSKTYIKLGSQPIAEKKVLYKIGYNPFLTSKEYNVTITKEVRVNEIYELSKQLQTKDKIVLDYSKAFIQWRFSNPATNYYFSYVYKNNELKAFIVFYKINKHRIYVLDYKYSNERALKVGFNQIHKSRNIMSQLWSISKDNNETSLLNKIGFKSYDKVINRIKKEDTPPVLIRPSGSDLENEDSWLINGLDIRKEHNWDINLICSDGI